MKEKKKRDTPAFEYQEFIAENKINVKELPKHLQKMIRITNKQERDSRKKCTEAHYKVVVKNLQPFADVIENALYEHFDHLLPSDGHDEPEEDTIEQKLIGATELNDRQFLYSAELRHLGIPFNLDKKVIEVGELELTRELGTAKWYLGTTKNYKGGHS